MFQLKMSELSSTRMSSRPKSYRQEILSMAHATPLSGHMGVTKTCQKILNHFYWLSLRKDVANFANRVMPARWLENRIRLYQKPHYSPYQQSKSL